MLQQQHGGIVGSEARKASYSTPKADHGVLSLPARWKGHQPAGAGLNNLGNTCYLNSTLQCLAYIPPLGHLCLTAGHSSACGRAIPQLTSGGAPCALCLVERTLASLLRGDRGGAVSPGELLRQLHRFGRSFVRGRQEDSAELLTALLDVAERDARREAVARGAPKNCRTIVEDLFVGCWQSQVRCLGCGHESNTYESFATLPLDIGQARTVSEGLKAFTEAERLDGSNKYRCDRCRQLCPAIKQTTIWDDPNVLVLHLKRFDGGSFLGKLSRHVAFPELLDLGPFTTPPAARRRAEQQHAAALAAAAAQKAAAEQGQQPQGADGNGHHHHHHHPHDNDRHHSHRTDDRGADGERSGPRGAVYGPQLPPHDARPNGNGASRHHDHPHHHESNGHLTGQHGHHHHHTHQSHPDSHPDPTPAAGPSVYQLSGVLVHQGSSLHSGHYYAAVRDSADRWSVMNDSQVYSTTLEQVRQEQAYLLFYTRQSMKLPRPAPVVPPAPAPPAAVSEEPAAPQPQRRMIGPQLPPGIVRLKAAAAAAGGAGAGVPVAAAAGGVDGLPPPRQRPVASAAPSARLPAKTSPTGAAASAAGAQTGAPSAIGPAHRPAIGPAPRPVAVPEPEPRPSAAAAAASTPASPGTARKRKHDDVAAADAAEGSGGDAAAEGAAAAGDDPRGAVEAEVKALQAGAGWREGVKRLKLTITDMVRKSDFMAVARSTVAGFKASGMSLSDVLEVGDHTEEGRRRLKRAVPQAAMRLGTEELRRMLRSILMALGGTIGGVLPGAGVGAGLLPLL